MSTDSILLDARDVSVHFGGIIALDGLNVAVESGHINGLIGPNGAGKTTLFNVISRVYDATHGDIDFAGRDLLAVPPHQIARIGMARTFQNISLFSHMSMLENVMIGAQIHCRGNWATAMIPGLASRSDRSARVRCMEALDLLGLASQALAPVGGLPFGTQKRVELARALVSEPRLLMLDEPANGLSHGEVEELGELIVSLRNERDLTILLVEHHMRLVMSVCDRITVLNFGKHLAHGTPTEIQNNPAVIEAYLGSSS